MSSGKRKKRKKSGSGRNAGRGNGTIRIGQGHGILATRGATGTSVARSVGMMTGREGEEGIIGMSREGSTGTNRAGSTGMNREGWTIAITSIVDTRNSTTTTGMITGTRIDGMAV